ncbi:MAG: hypothetical protein HC912_08705 [Saprospiraceae bacterium]|nr:hypothetical protein [Saprospiraceae bacterium]
MLLAITLALLFLPALEAWKTLALLLSLLLLIGHLLFYNVWRSYQYLKRGAILQAEQLLRYAHPAMFCLYTRDIIFSQKAWLLFKKKNLPMA